MNQIWVDQVHFRQSGNFRVFCSWLTSAVVVVVVESFLFSFSWFSFMFSSLFHSKAFLGTIFGNFEILLSQLFILTNCFSPIDKLQIRSTNTWHWLLSFKLKLLAKSFFIFWLFFFFLGFFFFAFFVIQVIFYLFL